VQESNVSECSITKRIYERGHWENRRLCFHRTFKCKILEGRVNVVDSYLISEIEGYSPQIGRLISMMNYARYTTYESVKDLSTLQLDHLDDDDSNSIGALLFHIASIEYFYRTWTFEDRDLNLEEKQFWDPGIKLGELGREHVKGKDLAYYLDLLTVERSKTLECFRGREDSWLDIEKPLNHKPSNHYFHWFHVFEDELNHRGQIRLLRKKRKRAGILEEGSRES